MTAASCMDYMPKIQTFQSFRWLCAWDNLTPQSICASIRRMTQTAILVEGLTKRFGEVVALDGVDFSVPAGTVFGLLGPNGAGKTNAVRVLATVLGPDGGRGEVRGPGVGAE